VSRRGWIITVVVFVVLVAAVLIGRFAGGGAGVDPTYRTVIDGYEARRDCVSLQDSFNGADDAAKLEYIDDALRSAGCYND
jgi:hypothetical protein